MAEAASISLRHVTFVNDGEIHFYTGSAKYEGGVLTLPLARREWAQKAWYDGFRIDAETGEQIRSMEAFLAAKRAALRA